MTSSTRASFAGLRVYGIRPVNSRAAEIVGGARYRRESSREVNAVAESMSHAPPSRFWGARPSSHLASCQRGHFLSASESSAARGDGVVGVSPRSARRDVQGVAAKHSWPEAQIGAELLDEQALPLLQRVDIARPAQEARRQFRIDGVAVPREGADEDFIRDCERSPMQCRPATHSHRAPPHVSERR